MKCRFLVLVFPIFLMTACSSLPKNAYEKGMASWYGGKFHGRKTASGEKFNKYQMTAAHKTLAFGTVVRVVSESTGRSVMVRINDRGPFVSGRIIDLSRAAAEKLGIIRKGHDSVILYLK